METLQQHYFQWNHFWKWSLESSDPRTKSWFLMESPWPTLQLTALYLVIVYYGPKFMKDRAAIECKTLLALYNLALVILNLYIFLEILISSTLAGYSYQCQKVNYEDQHHELRLAKALWWYYFSKLIEFLDTIFFVVRKKDSQITFLHVYHHATMFPLWWIGIRWVAGGMAFFGAMINSFIHVVMYSYYGLSSLGPGIQKYLWWKRYLTKLQLVQFLMAMVYAIQGIYLQCDFPMWMQYAFFLYGMSMMVLFSNFYLQTYLKNKNKKSGVKKNGTAANGSSHSQLNGTEKMNGSINGDCKDTKLGNNNSNGVDATTMKKMD